MLGFIIDDGGSLLFLTETKLSKANAPYGQKLHIDVPEPPSSRLRPSTASSRSHTTLGKKKGKQHAAGLDRRLQEEEAPFKVTLTFIDNGVTTAKKITQDLDVEVLVSSFALNARYRRRPRHGGAFVVLRLIRRAALRARDRRPRRPADPGRAVLRRRRRGRARRLVRRARRRLDARRGSSTCASGRWCRIPLAVEVLLGALGVFVFARHASTRAWRAPTASSDNLAPTVVYVGFWIGVPFASLLFGNVFRLLSPWRAIGRVDRLGSRRASRAATLPEPLPYPDRLGHWPAVAGHPRLRDLRAVLGGGEDPAPLAILMLVYLAIQLVGMSLYGVEAWTRNGDAFGVWFGLLARLAPFGRRADGALVLRPPVVSATAADGDGRHDRAAARRRSARRRSTARKRRPAVQRPRRRPAGRVHRPRAVAGLRRSSSRSSSGCWSRSPSSARSGRVGVLGMPRRGLRLSHLELGRRFVHTLIPIAAAYLVAHYFSLLAYNGQALWRLASDPLGDGSDLFGGAARGDRLLGRLGDRDLVRPGRRARARPRRRAGARARPRARRLRRARARRPRSQIVMLVVMVAFTCLGLWLLSAALNQ